MRPKLRKCQFYNHGNLVLILKKKFKQFNYKIGILCNVQIIFFVKPRMSIIFPIFTDHNFSATNHIRLLFWTHNLITLMNKG